MHATKHGKREKVFGFRPEAGTIIAGAVKPRNQVTYQAESRRGNTTACRILVSTLRVFPILITVDRCLTAPAIMCRPAAWKTLINADSSDRTKIENVRNDKVGT